MRKLLLTTAITTLGFATAANASLISVTFSSDGLGTLPAGYDLVTDFSTSTGLSGTYGLVTGSSTGNDLAPATGPLSQDSHQYLSVFGGESATLTLPKETGVAVYIGSWDRYNNIAFSNGLSYSGSTLAALTGTSPAYGSEFDASANGWFVFNFTPADAVTSVMLSSGQNSLEVAAVAGSVPEPSTWAMMLAGFAGLGFLGFHRRSRQPVALSF